MCNKFKSIVFIAIIFISLSGYAQETINLAGEWQVKLDPQNKGIEEQWFNENTFTDVLTLPGCIQEQGYGNIPGPNTPWYGNTEWAGSGGLNGWGPDYLSKYKEQGIYKMQHFLHPDRHFIGPVWYSKSIEIPESWEGKQITVSFERVHWVSQLWINGKEVGKATSLAAPHHFNLGQLTPGSHTITIRVDNSEYVHMGYNAHSVSEQTAGTWNGIVGDIKLAARPEVWIERFTVSPKPVDGMLKVSLQLGKTITAKGKWELTLDAIGISKGNEHNPEPFVIKGNVNEIDGKMLHFDYPMTDKALLWDEYEQNLYQIEAKLKTKKSNDSRQLTFGLRDISVDGMHFSVNGFKTFIRGNNDCAVMPATGYAPMDVESWRKVWRTYKDFGLNLARFHSWTPPKAAFIAADEIGIYMAPEVGEWGPVNKKSQFEFMRAEAKRIIDEFGHHPSFVMMGLGNEYDGNHDFFTEVVQEWKAYDNSKLYMVKANSWSPAEADYQVQRGIWPERTTKLRYQFGWPPTPDRTEYNLAAPNTAIDWREASSSFKVPVMSHEIAQICTYPDVETELKKYTGYLKADYLEIARDQLIERGMYALLPEIVESSGKWQVELIREAFEAAYRTPDMAGFQWLSLADFTGQSSAPVGLTDPFYDARPYVDLEYIRQWCAPTVLLARIPKRVLIQSETFKADLEVTHFGKEKLVLNDLTATLRKDDGTVIKTWELPKKTFTQESAQAIASIELELSSISAPAKLNLQLESKANKLINDWNIWVYPDAQAETFPVNVHVAKAWNEETQKRLEAGETVLLLPQIGDMKGNLPSCFTNHFWTAIGDKGGQSSASGMLMNPEHPLFAAFPTDAHVNWNWWDILNHAQPMILDAFDAKNPWPKDYRSIIQPVDSWKINRKLALVAEAKVGKGKLLICSIDIESDLENRPATRQFRKSLLNYLTTSAFNPQWEIQPEAIAEVFEKETGPAKEIDFKSNALPIDN